MTGLWSYLRGVYLVARREYLAYVGAWGFWVSLATTPLLLFMVIAMPIALSRAEPTRYLTAIAERAGDADAVRAAFETGERETLRAALWEAGQKAGAPEAALRAFDAERDIARAESAGRAALDRAQPGAGARFRAPARAYEFVLAPAPDIEGLKPYLSGARTLGGAPLFGAFVVRGAGADLRLDYWSMNLTDQKPANRVRAALAERMRAEALAARGLSPEEAARLQTLAPAFAQFDPRPAASGSAVTESDRAPFIVAIGLAVLLWSSVMGVANMLLTGVLEEKSNKILDALMTSVSPLQILAGKLIGVAAVSATLFSIWGLLGAIGLSRVAALDAGGFAAALAHAALNPALAGTFMACFVAGYLLYGAAFLGLGALCDSLQEAQTLISPIFVMLVLPIVLIGPAFESPKSPLIVAASWFPPFTPFIMMMRAPAGLTPVEAAGPVVVTLVALALVLTGAARMFRAGVSHQLKVGDLFARLRGKPAA